jgi:DUF4097 and DUF4098 domain-containing protein YvlB
MRPFLLPIAALLILSGVSGCVAGFPAVEGEFERTLNTTGPVTLEVSTGSGTIEVKAGAPGVVKIRGQIKARDGRGATADEKVRYLQSNPPIEQNRDVIRVGRIEDDSYRNNVSISYVLEAPADTRLTASTGSGSLRINGLRGRVDGSTGSGSIDISNVGDEVNARTGSGSIQVYSANGRIDMSTGSGSIKAEGIAGSIKASAGSGGITLKQVAVERGAPPDVEARTGSGGIDVSGVFGSLRAMTGSGSIRASGNPMGSWSVQTSSGNVSIEMTPAAAFDLYARTGSGRINTDLSVEVKGSMGRNELRGKVRGGGNLVEVRTSSGSISIR